MKNQVNGEGDNSTFVTHNSTFVTRNSTFITRNSTFVTQNSAFFILHSSFKVLSLQGEWREGEWYFLSFLILNS